MQFSVRLLAQTPSARIPFNYPYLLTGWLYRVLADADRQYTAFLHERGYQVTAEHSGRLKTFRLFTFSDLRLHGYDVRPREGCFVLTSPVVDWTLSFYVDRAAEAFIRGLFADQRLTLVNRHVRTELLVERVETRPLPFFGEALTLRTLSPVVVAEKDLTGMDQYLHPADERFGPLLLHNLVDKYRSAGRGDAGRRSDAGLMSAGGEAADVTTAELGFTLLSHPDRIRSRLIAIKEGSPQETKVRGYYGFDFTLRAPADVLEVALLAGVGRYNAEGFGCVGVV